VEEAVYLGDKIVVMHSRPGRIQKIITVPLPRPRNRVHPEFVKLKEEALIAIAGGDGVKN
jgi:sulfonate transport system ATP-binding protein